MCGPVCQINSALANSPLDGVSFFFFFFAGRCGSGGGVWVWVTVFAGKLFYCSSILKEKPSGVPARIFNVA